MWQDCSRKTYSCRVNYTTHSILLLCEKALSNQDLFEVLQELYIKFGENGTLLSMEKSSFPGLSIIQQVRPKRLKFPMI